VDSEYGGSFSLTGWAEEAGGPDPNRFGIPLVVVAGLLLGSAGFAAGAHWVPRWRRAVLAGAVLVVGALVSVAWLVTGYARDVVDTVVGYGDGSAIEAETGAGTLLATLALLAGLGGLASLVVGAVLDRTASTQDGTR
jgi:hypothetical protein